MYAGFCGVLALGCLISLQAWANEDKESLIKAAFLYNFVKFVEWPDDAANTARHIDICVLGGNGFAEVAGKVLKEASSPMLQLNLVTGKTPAEAAGQCRVVYVSHTEEGNAQEIIDALKSAPVLTVSDIPNFADKQGMIGFVQVEKKIKLVINADAISRANLRVDAQLLEIAYKVIRN